VSGTFIKPWEKWDAIKDRSGLRLPDGTVTCVVCGHTAHYGRCDADLDQERRCHCEWDVCYNCLQPHPDVPGHDDRTCPHCERLCETMGRAAE
jgi:hypothetical protein